MRCRKVKKDEKNKRNKVKELKEKEGSGEENKNRKKM